MESGHNDNGYWRKYGDGTLEMWNDKRVGTINITTPDNWNYYNGGVINILTPVESVGYVLPIVSARGACGPWASAPATGLGTDRFQVWIYASSSSPTQDIWVTWHAFGRWK